MCIPLVIEPASRVFASPVIVLDFQSLYPSLIIAYNMCYCTLLGCLKSGGSGFLDTDLGVLKGFSPPVGVLSLSYTGGVGAATSVRCNERSAIEILTEADRPPRPTSAFVAPNGAVFVPSAVRAGVLPRMLQVCG